MWSWIIWILVALLIGGYVWLFLYTWKRQKAFEAQYNAKKERHEVFVLSKKVTKERPQTGAKWMRYMKLKTYHVVGRVSVSQAVRGIQMSRMQTVTFHTTKREFDKIQPNHKYKMDIAGNYIGYVVAPVSVKGKGKDTTPAKAGGWRERLKRFGRRDAAKARRKSSK
ncbi:MAG: hypothetical protein K6T83_13070 [Alicyclobacillus sp.]|nr:hypothetical protein [Alicyclobacillus sp.]